MKEVKFLNNMPLCDTTARAEVGKLSEDIADLKQNGSGTGNGLTTDLKTVLKNYFTNIQTLITQMAFSTDAHIGSTLITDAQAIVTALGNSTSEDEGTEQPESGIVQTENILAITSGVTATQTGTVLVIA